MAALVAGLPEADGFALAGGSGLAAHGLLDRQTQGLDYFATPDRHAAVGVAWPPRSSGPAATTA